MVLVITNHCGDGVTVVPMYICVFVWNFCSKCMLTIQWRYNYVSFYFHINTKPCFAIKTFSNYISITLTANTPISVLYITFFITDACKSCSTIFAEGNKMLLSIKQIPYHKKDILLIFTIKILCFIMYRD